MNDRPLLGIGTGPATSRNPLLCNSSQTPRMLGPIMIFAQTEAQPAHQGPLPGVYCPEEER